MLCNRNLHSLQKLYFKNKLLEQETRFVVIRGKEQEKGELDEGYQKVI